MITIKTKGEFLMSKGYFLLYLIYGFAFINMGMFSIQEKDLEITNLPLVKSLKYLGYFGIFHGISEWMTMITFTELFIDNHYIIFNIKQVFKGISFASLMYFGLRLLPLKQKKRKVILKIPISFLIIWFIGFLWLIYFFGQDYHSLNPEYNTIILRYIMALPGGIISAIALYLNSRVIEKNKSYKMAKRYKSLAIIFFLYGLLEGLLVNKMNFFPANIVNSQLFMEIFGFPTQILKASVGIFINILLIKVIDTFGWEQKEKIKRLEEHRITSEARRKLGFEIHDGIIQGLYAAGLKIEYLMKNDVEYKRKALLVEIKNDLNNTIEKTREFLSSSTLETIQIEDFNYSLQQMVNKYNESQNIKISLNSQISSLKYGQLSSENCTQIFYILQEAISNVIKHSKATKADVNLEVREEALYIEVLDNGVGINTMDYDHSKHFGITSMETRAERIGGLFSIETVKNGTRIKLIVPWEGK